MSEVISPSPSLRVVDTEDGPVTVTTIAYLESLSAEKQADLKQLADQVKQLESERAEMQLEAGRALTTRSGDWSSTERMPRIEAARGLEQLVANLNRSIGETVARPRRGIGGLFQSLRDKHEAAELESKVQSATTELNNRYRAVADRLEPATGIADVDTLLAQLARKRSEIADLTDRSQRLKTELVRLSDELKATKRCANQPRFRRFRLTSRSDRQWSPTDLSEPCSETERDCGRVIASHTLPVQDTNSVCRREPWPQHSTRTWISLSRQQLSGSSDPDGCVGSTRRRHPGHNQSTARLSWHEA